MQCVGSLFEMKKKLSKIYLWASGCLFFHNFDIGLHSLRFSLGLRKDQYNDLLQLNSTFLLLSRQVSKRHALAAGIFACINLMMGLGSFGCVFVRIFPSGHGIWSGFPVSYRFYTFNVHSKLAQNVNRRAISNSVWCELVKSAE